MVCTPRELEDYSRTAPPDGVCWGTLCFSAKEAFYKAYHPVGRSFLDFLDVRVRFQRSADHSGAFRVEAVSARTPLAASFAAFQGRWVATPQWLFCGVVLTSSALAACSDASMGSSIPS